MISLVVGLSGALGALSRYYLGWIANDRYSIPFGTWIANVSGAILLGILTKVHLSNPSFLSESYWGFLAIGFCGAYTTLSTFSAETFALIQKKQYKNAIIYTASTLLVSIIIVAMIIGFGEF
ncbi:fluoride efflux transporter CrcB [Bacillaceae bacterium S4-13-58]